MSIETRLASLEQQRNEGRVRVFTQVAGGYVVGVGSMLAERQPTHTRADLDALRAHGHTVITVSCVHKTRAVNDDQDDATGNDSSRL